MPPYLPLRPPKKPPVALASYLEAIRLSLLLDQAQLDAALHGLGAPPDDSSSSVQLAQRLEQQGLLTAWQNRWLLTGEHQRLVFGPYKLLDRLSHESGYLAEHRQDQRRVSLRMIAQYGDRFADRVQKEVELHAKLRHPHVLSLVHAGDVGGWHYIAPEATATNLEEIVRREGPLAYDRAVRYVRQAADGLAYLNSMGCVHRDIKPSALLVDAADDVRIHLCAWSVDREQELPDEHRENVVGTADYLAPFIALDTHLTDYVARFAVYSLGCVLYFSLTGHAPFAGGTLAQRLMKHQTQDPPAITIDRPDCPADLIAILLRMKSRRHEELYSAAEASQALSTWLERYERGEIAPPPEPETPPTPETFPPLRRAASRRRSWWPWS